MTISDVIQLAAVLVAVAASVIALVIATVDRKTQLRIAEKDRAQARLAVELEYAVRLSANRNMGGSADPAESKRLGAEALALAVVVGKRWVPRQYDHVMDGRTPEEIAAMFDNDESPQWVKWRNEAAVAVQAIVDEMYETSPRHRPAGNGDA
ncbi:hypothetical protein QSU92_01180 [Microbacterium sp. ET2]|uniref:hypothetical protein n=1 Tax=Microbacterium albipurpureum TaxID=3050384 RepID=UPI00259C8371|nr:hypothetical protein [Microbacterium sp. ET2 (Ac-2212)]WJL95869.1 hypothetical protein QSU92_01180 [Microbacterium sp. ET2 (Ac-2212)]